MHSQLTTNNGLGTRRGALILLLVYAAVSLHMLAIRCAGGLDAVPFVLFGACQWVPGLLALSLAPGWRSQLVRQLQTPVGLRRLLACCLLVAATLGLCTVMPVLSGHTAPLFDAEVWREYRLLCFVPAGLRNPAGFLAFVLLAAPLLHLVNAASEEIFWRGYLLDWLEARMPQGRAWLLDGVLWGLWHAPMIAWLGWDFPGQPGAGILAITASQVVWSLVLCSVTRRTGSLWPAIAMHATANALTIGLYDLVVDHRFNLLYSPWGLLGGAAMALAAAALLPGRRAALRLVGARS